MSTIDGFQGDQNDVIILSLVRCNRDGAIGFLMEQSRRCVAQSRARCALVIIGSAATLTHSPASPWGPLLRQALLTGRNFGRETRKLIDPFFVYFRFYSQVSQSVFRIRVGFNTDPDPGFHLGGVDSDPGSHADQCGSGSGYFPVFVAITILKSLIFPDFFTVNM